MIYFFSHSFDGLEAGVEGKTAYFACFSCASFYIVHFFVLLSPSLAKCSMSFHSSLIGEKKKKTSVY